MIRFQYSFEHALRVICYLLRRLGPIDKAKLMKLLYIADREAFLRHGAPMTGARQVAMRWGPVPSECLDTVDGEYSPHEESVYQFIHLDDTKVHLRSEASGSLSPAEQAILEHVIDEHGAKATFQLCRETHAFPEYAEAYVEGTARPIPWESILRHHGGEDKYRHGRAVVSRATAAQMLSPFRSSEGDL